MSRILLIIAVATATGCEPRPPGVGEAAPAPPRMEPPAPAPPRAVAAVPPKAAAPRDPTWRPPRTAGAAVVPTSFRIVDSRSAHVLEVSDGGLLPGYLSTGPRPRSPLARLYSDFSTRALDGALWYHVDPATGQLVDDLRAEAGRPSELSCHLSEAAVLHCRASSREQSFWIAPSGTIVTRQSATVTGDTSWSVIPPPSTPDEARRALLVFWHTMVIAYLSPPDPQ